MPAIGRTQGRMRRQGAPTLKSRMRRRRAEVDMAGHGRGSGGAIGGVEGEKGRSQDAEEDYRSWADRDPEAEGEGSKMGDVARKRKSESEVKQRKQEA